MFHYLAPTNMFSVFTWVNLNDYTVLCFDLWPPFRNRSLVFHSSAFLHLSHVSNSGPSPNVTIKQITGLTLCWTRSKIDHAQATPSLRSVRVGKVAICLWWVHRAILLAHKEPVDTGKEVLWDIHCLTTPFQTCSRCWRKLSLSMQSWSKRKGLRNH